MKRKFFLSIGLISLVIFLSFRIVHASTLPVAYGKVFGGKIIYTEAEEIASLEDSGYDCDVPGSSIEIQPVAGPSSYLIPDGVTSKTGYETRVGQWILGKYNGKTTVTCTMDCGDTECVETVTLNTITLFGTSK